MRTRRGPARPRSVPAILIAAGGFALSLPAASADIWECSDQGNKYFTNVNPNKPHYLCTSRDNPKVRVISPEGGPGCEYRASQPPGSCRTLALPAPAVAPPPGPAPADSISLFRERLKIGDRSSAGLVVEIRPPIARIQTATSERWFRIDELYPAR